MGGKTTSLLICNLVVLAAVGCSKQPTRYPVAGKVLIDGESLTTGTIQFVPEGGRPFASKIGKDGSFRLAELTVSKESKNPGVTAGKYRIAVSSAEVVDEDQEEMLRNIPGKYANFRTSELEVEITEPREDLVIELTWEGAEEVAEVEEDGDSQPETELKVAE